jgi:lauroyl/myristoyl acyltransferase
MSQTGVVSDGHPAQGAHRNVVRSIGTPEQHERIGKLNPRDRYVAWQAISDQLLDAQVLEEFRLGALANLTAINNAGLIRLDPSESAARFVSETRNNLCLLLSLAPDTYRSQRSALCEIEGLEDYLRETADRPAVLLGDHLHSFHCAVLALAASRFPIHMMSLVPPGGVPFQDRWSHLGELAKRYVDPARGLTVPPIMIPSPTASIHLLRALRRNEAIFFNVDSELGIAATSGDVSFLGRPMAVPRAIYELAIGASALFYSLTITREGQDDRVEDHRFVIEIKKLPTPSKTQIDEFHAERLRLVEERLKAAPHAWLIWRFADYDKRPPRF